MMKFRILAMIGNVRTEVGIRVYVVQEKYNTQNTRCPKDGDGYYARDFGSLVKRKIRCLSERKYYTNDAHHHEKGCHKYHGNYDTQPVVPLCRKEYSYHYQRDHEWNVG